MSSYAIREITKGTGDVNVNGIFFFLSFILTNLFYNFTNCYSLFVFKKHLYVFRQ